MSNAKKMICKVMPDGFMYVIDIASGKAIQINPRVADFTFYIVEEHPSIEVLKKSFEEQIEMAHFELKQ